MAREKARGAITSEPGASYTNDTAKVLWQLIVSWDHSCAKCIQFDHQLNAWWPIPFHLGCNCQQVPVQPGETAQPFVDFREKINELSPDNQRRVMGISNLALVNSGLVKWDTVVTRSRILDLHEVVARENLSVAQLLKAGVGRGQAQRAWNLVHPDSQEAKDAAARKVIAAAKKAGATDERIKAGVVGKVKPRLGINEGHSKESPVKRVGKSDGGDTTPPVVKPEPKPKPSPKPKAEKPTPVPVPVPVAAPAPKAAPQPASIHAPIQDQIANFRKRIPAAIQEALTAAKPISEAVAKAKQEIADIKNERLKIIRGEVKLSVEKFKKELDKSKKLLEDKEARLAYTTNVLKEHEISIREAIETKARSLEVRGEKLVHDLPVDAIPQAESWLRKNFTITSKEPSGFQVYYGSSINTPLKGRAHYNPRVKKINLSPTDTTGFVIHEYGHAIEDHFPDIARLSNEYLKYRIHEEKPQQLNKLDVFSGYSFGDDEIGCEDRFSKTFGVKAWYVGKIYESDPDALPATEILSMGLEQMHDNPLHFHETDPEYFAFVLGLMRGEYR